MSHETGFIQSFIEVAKKNNDRCALVIGTQSWSYEDLLHLSKAFKEELKALGYPKVVAVMGDQDIAVYTGLLAILELGLVFVPLNSKDPVERLISIIELADVEVIIPSQDSQNKINALLSSLPTDIVILRTVGDGAGKPIKKTTSKLPTNYNKQGICYLTFTSGTTAEPKAVPIFQTSATHYFDVFLKAFDFCNEDRFMQMSDLSFDNLHELFICWLSGGCLYPVPDEARFAVTEFISTHKITVLNSVPSLTTGLKKLNLLIPNGLPTLRHILMGGEPLRVEDLSLWQSAAPHAQVTNLYGPAETTMFISLYSCPNPLPIAAQMDGVVTIGRLLAPHLFLLLDENGKQLPTGKAVRKEGELLISGPQVFSGYLSDDSSKDKYLFKKDAVLWYRTGDWATVNTDGLIHFRGRRDQQVKINGYRVNLSGVEAVISSAIPERRAIVLKSESTQTLICFVECVESKEVQSELVRKIKAVSEKNFPAYMVPKKYIFIDSLPLNQNGKTDRKKLQTEFHAELE